MVDERTIKMMAYIDFGNDVGECAFPLRARVYAFAMSTTRQLLTGGGGQT